MAPSSARRASTTRSIVALPTAVTSSVDADDRLRACDDAESPPTPEETVPCWCQSDRLSPSPAESSSSTPTMTTSSWRPKRRSWSFLARFADTVGFSSSPSPASSSSSRRPRRSKSTSSWFSAATVWFIVFLLLIDVVVDGCGPGRRAGRRRRPRKLTPLVFKQHVPNVSENTLAASGLTEGRVSRGSKRFEDLVPNYNPDIIFKDEEGTGADRFMTPRCKEKLNTLAISVMNQWPDVKLRVTEGWDEEGYHAPQSLHYEGRAVDIATSDRDRSKYGMLARLAVEAGFDWVFYESRSHIHCSVKSETSQGKSGGCFPGSSQVTTPEGPKPLSELAVGDSVLTMTQGGRLVYRPVLMFLDKNPSSPRTFIEITTSTGRKMSLTPSHLVYVVNEAQENAGPGNGFFDGRVPFETAGAGNEVDVDTKQNPKFKPASTPDGGRATRSARAVFARQVQPGMSVLVAADGVVASETVAEAVPVLGNSGFFAPLTSEGTVVVDNVVASCYAVVEDQYLAHWAFWPVRTYYRVKHWFSAPAPTSTERRHTAAAGTTETVDQTRRSDGAEDSRGDGIHWYAKMLYSLAEYVLPERMLYEKQR